MRRALSLLPLLCVSSLAYGNCRNNPVYCDILTLNPSVDKTFALKLSNSIAKYSKKFNLDPKLSVAIAMQESSFQNVNRLGTVLTERNHVVNGATDIGVFQIHIETIADMRERGSNLDPHRLRSDVDYQAFWHALILKKKIATCSAKRDKLSIPVGEEWSCYHSATPKVRKAYVELVNQYLVKLDYK